MSQEYLKHSDQFEWSGQDIWKNQASLLHPRNQPRGMLCNISLPFSKVFLFMISFTYGVIREAKPLDARRDLAITLR